VLYAPIIKSGIPSPLISPAPVTEHPRPLPDDVILNPFIPFKADVSNVAQVLCMGEGLDVLYGVNVIVGLALGVRDGVGVLEARDGVAVLE
jgi:hypothetical protein